MFPRLARAAPGGGRRFPPAGRPRAGSGHGRGAGVRVVGWVAGRTPSDGPAGRLAAAVPGPALPGPGTSVAATRVGVGVYLEVLEPGTVRLGDAVAVQPSP